MLISNVQNTDDIILLTMSLEELQQLVNRVERVVMDYNMLIRATK